MATANLGRVGFVNKGAYSGATAYKVNDVVVYNSGIYACIQANTGQAPTNTSYWQNWVQNTKIDRVTSTNNAIVRFDGTTGSVKNSDITIDDAGNLSHSNGGIYSYGAYGILSSDYAGNTTKIVRWALLDTSAVFESITQGARRSAILANGSFQSATNSYGSTSDAKLKENIVDATPKLEKIMQVKVRNFNYIGDEQKQIGVVAQEIEQIFPSIVFETKDTKEIEVKKIRQVVDKEAVLSEDGVVIEEATYEDEEYIDIETVETGETTKNVKYSVIYMMMLKAMQEQQEIINDLKARVEVLEAKNA